MNVHAVGIVTLVYREAKMDYYDPQKNPLNKYKLRNLIASDCFLSMIAVLGFVAFIIHFIGGL